LSIWKRFTWKRFSELMRHERPPEDMFAAVNARVFAQAANSPELQSARFAIDGYTNAVGGRDYNLALSKSRESSLVEYLVSQGVDKSRMEVNGYGFDRPLNAANPRASENRRVEARRLQ
jgi:outer membrane protein OmpA-like peptidoglycan-associated protein